MQNDEIKILPIIGDEDRKAIDKIHAAGLEGFYALRKKWSWTIIAWISALILFHIIVTILVGCKVLDFSNQKFLIQTIIGTNFLEIVGMGVIIIKFLYPAPLKPKETQN